MPPKFDLRSIGRRHFVSLSGLEAVLSELRDADMLNEGGSLSRRSIKRSRDKHIASLQTDIGPVMRTLKVQLQQPSKEYDMWFIHPCALLLYMSAECEGFSAFMQHVISKHPCSPNNKLSIVIYSDEVSPGNQLKHDNQRKLQAVYWSIKQFGGAALASEEYWFILTAVRSTLVKRLEAGMSELLATTIQLFFQEPHSIYHNGLTLRFNDNTFGTIYASVDIMVSDESALKASLEMKGSSGSKICALCQNIVAHNSRLDEHDATGFLRPSTVLDIREFAMCTDDIIYQTVDTLQHIQNTAPGQLKKMQQATGFNLKPKGLLMCQPLRGIIKPATMLMYDWMHVYLVGGAFNHEAGLLLSLLHLRARLTHKEIHTFVNKFNWQVLMPSTGSKVFEKRTAISGELKCSASEALSVYNVFRYFLETVATPRAGDDQIIIDAIACFFALCDVLDLLRRVVRGTVSSADLHAAILNHLTVYKRVHGVDEWYPKLHYALHLATMLEQHGCLVSCFVHERKHKELKRTANNLQNTSGAFEKPVLDNSLYSQIQWHTEHSALYNGPSLHNPRPCSPSLAQLVHDALNDINCELWTSRDVTYAPGQKASASDMILYDSGDGGPKVGQVMFHVSVDGTVCTCVKPWKHLHGKVYEAEHVDPLLLMSGFIMETCIYARVGNSSIVLPF